MAIHENLGCPENSKCSKKMGLIHQQWVEIAKSTQKNKLRKLQSFASSFGAPVSIWGLNKAEANSSYIIWDSSCKNHNHEEKPRITYVDTFAKDFSDLLNKTEEVIVPKGLILEGKGRIVSVPLLRSDAPVLLSKDSVFYIQENEGLYYTLEIKRSGKLNIIKTPTPTKLPGEVTCPKELDEAFAASFNPPNLYLGHFCKQIWNISTNSYQVMALGWSCN